MRAATSFASLLLVALPLVACGKSGDGSTGTTSSSSGAGGSTSTTTTTTSGSASGVGGATSSSSSSGSGGAGTGGSAGMPCGIYAGDNFFNCSPDGNGRGKCDSGMLVYEDCPRGCLIEPLGQDDICMGTTDTWSCSGSYGTTKVEDGDYYATEFGCWTDGNGNTHTDPGDNCIPTCLSKAQSDGLCAGLSGPACEESVNWYAADGARFGCLARLRVENPANGKAIVVVALDYGPSCTVENDAQKAVLDLSGAANQYLFGGPQGWADMALVHVVEVSKSTPLGPIP